MKYEKVLIPDVSVIIPEPFTDDRGVFRRHFCEKEFRDHKISSNVKQANVSENLHAYTLRGFHYQISPYGEGKTLSCLHGAIYDIVVDLRPNSPTYLKWLSFELNNENRLSIHIPPGCANAFLTLKDNCLIHYYCSESYNSQAERGIRYNDPLFSFVWPTAPLFISDKDKNHPNFKPNL